MSVAADMFGIIRNTPIRKRKSTRKAPITPKNSFELLPCPARRGDLNDKSFMALD
jgi:hypothetical protein